MKRNVVFLSSIIAAGAAAAYLFDGKKGKKRRKILRKKANRSLQEGRLVLHGCSRRLEPHWRKYSERMKDGMDRSLQKVQAMTKNGWSPSARVLGTTASAAAYYSAGRKGAVAGVMRTIAFGLFTRALFANK